MNSDKIKKVTNDLEEKIYCLNENYMIAMTQITKRKQDTDSTVALLALLDGGYKHGLQLLTIIVDNGDNTFRLFSSEIKEGGKALYVFSDIDEIKKPEFSPEVSKLNPEFLSMPVKDIIDDFMHDENKEIIIINPFSDNVYYLSKSMLKIIFESK